jgi:hypothetical protein
VPNEPDLPNIPVDSSDAPDAAVPHSAKAKTIAEVVASCKVTLEKYWAEVKDRADAGNTDDFLEDKDLLGAINYSINCKEKTYHYVLLTQLMAKADDPARNCRSLQDQAPVSGAFDARSIAHGVSVDFERRQLDGALGQSSSPYLNNSIRAPLLDENDGKKRRDKLGWRRVCEVAAEVESRNNVEFTAKVFRQVLLDIYRRLGSTKIKYDVPLRASLAQIVGVIRKFTSEKSGGDRPLAVTAALFETLGKYANFFEPIVRRGRINASDASSGQVADVECVDAQGTVVIAIEVKDKTVTVSDLEEKLGATRERGIKEVFFVSGRGKKETEDVPARVAKEFNAGQNLYVCNLVELAESVLALTGEASRRHFLIDVGEQLDKYSDTKHRLAWKKTLDEMSNP